MQGLEYMVTHDPSANGTKVENSGVWVIRKQNRRKRQGMQDEVVPISCYYVVGINVCMAPTVGNVVGSRMVCSSCVALYAMCTVADDELALSSNIPHQTSLSSIHPPKLHPCSRPQLSSSAIKDHHSQHELPTRPSKQRRNSNAHSLHTPSRNTRFLDNLQNPTNLPTKIRH